MELNLFSFPPNENFDEQWNAALAHVQNLEINGRIKALETIGDCLDIYEQKLIDQHPLYDEQAKRIGELASLVFRVCDSSI